MTARAQATERTGERILQATSEVFFERPTTDISLDEIAGRAGVSVRTVIRRFGNKDDLLTAAAEWTSQQITSQRDAAPTADLARAITVLVDHYEERGDSVLRMLAAELEIPALKSYVDAGRKVHRDWCQRVFGPRLEAAAAPRRERLLAQVVTICDVYTWKLLRRDSQLSRSQTELALVEMLTPLIKE